jgi:hypothetical protein
MDGEGEEKVESPPKGVRNPDPEGGVILTLRPDLK